MEFLGDFHFLRPWWFAATIPLVIILWLLFRMQSGERSWETVCDRHLLPHILIGKDTARSKKFFLFLTATIGIVSILALAGPTAEKQPQPIFQNQAALVIAFDLSRSMNAVDVPPSRLVRARYKVSDLIKRYQSGGQFALVAYAADAFTVIPLTDDTTAFNMYVSSLESGLLPKQGSRPDLALQHAAALIEQAGLERGDILLVSDYVDSNRSYVMAKDLASRGFRVSVLGIGTKEGAPIQLKSGTLLSQKGKTVIARFEPTALRELARVGNGIYRQFDSVGEADIVALNGLFESAPKLTGEGNTQDAAQMFGDAWKEQGPWLVLFLLPLAALGFRRGLLILALAMIVPLPQPAFAGVWDDLWSRGDQQAMDAFEKGDTETAAELFDDPRWRAASNFRAGNYKQAAEALKDPQTSDDWYNLGNIQAHNGDFQNAIKSYKQSLELNPKMEDATFNMGVIKQLLQQQMQAQAQESNEEDSDGEEAQAQKSEAGEQDGEEDMTQNTDKQEQEENQQGDSAEEQAESEQQQEQADSESEESGQQDESVADEQGESGEEQTNTNEGETMPEDEQAIEQWLRQVQDNPSQMLKRKFRYQQRREGKNTAQGEDPW